MIGLGSDKNKYENSFYPFSSHSVHVESVGEPVLRGRAGRHCGQKRTYRAVRLGWSLGCSDLNQSDQQRGFKVYGNNTAPHDHTSFVHRWPISMRSSPARRSPGSSCTAHNARRSQWPGWSTTSTSSPSLWRSSMGSQARRNLRLLQPRHPQRRHPATPVCLISSLPRDQLVHTLRLLTPRWWDQDWVTMRSINAFIVYTFLFLAILALRMRQRGPWT